MSIDPFIEPSGSGQGVPANDGHDEAILQAQANAALERWLQDHPEVAGEIKETVRAHIYLQQLKARTQKSEQVQRITEQRDAALLTRHDIAGHRILGFAAGALLVVVLIILDAIPLNWAAQAFGLGPAGTWLVTFILVVASIGAMVGFESTSGHLRRRGLLAAVVATAYLALLGLRTQFLTTVASESLSVALLQSAMLTAISAGLVLCGSAVLARTRSLALSQSRTAARRARQAVADARAAQSLAAEKLQRHIGGLRQMLLPWALGAPTPAGVDKAQWAAALERAVRQLFPAS
jgi:hypothetical protein